MNDQQIGRINELLKSISYWWSIYDLGASKNLAELKDQIFDLQLDLQATVSVLPIIQQETQAQGGVALEQFGAGPSCAIPSLPSKIDGSENQVVPQVQHLMETLSGPITLEQLNEVLFNLKSIPPLIDDFLKKRYAMVIQLQQHYDHQPGVSSTSDQPPGQPGKRRIFTVSRQQLEEYEQLFRGPQTPEQENRILQHLQRNPPLMNFIIKERQFHNAWVTWLAGLDLDDGSSPAVAIQVNPQSAENFVLRAKCIELRVPDRQCNSANYQLASCKKMNMLVAHVKNCKKGKNGDCLACKRLRFFYGHHASLCQVQDNKCSVPFCFNIKQKLKQLPQHQKALHCFLLRFENSEDIIQCRGHYC